MLSWLRHNKVVKVCLLYFFLVMDVSIHIYQREDLAFFFPAESEEGLLSNLWRSSKVTQMMIGT